MTALSYFFDKHLLSL